MVIISRAKAKSLGLTRYFTGITCVNGHISEHYTCDFGCCACKKIKHKEWVIKNPSTANRIGRERGKRVTAKIQYNRSQGVELPIEFYNRKFRLKNRTARKKGAVGKYARNDVDMMLSRQHEVCAAKCGTLIVNSFHVDHKVPIIRGGSNWPSNLQLLCQPCNNSKGARTMDEWRPNL